MGRRPPLLALALSNQSNLHWLAFCTEDCVAAGERAVALAREVGDPAILSHALTHLGSARWQLGDPVSGLNDRGSLVGVYENTAAQPTRQGDDMSARGRMS